ncbi:MAG: SIS domain-containing protein [Marmoricola sp.]
MADGTASAAVEGAQSRALDVWAELVVALREPGLVEAVNAAGTSILQALEAGSKVIFVGNGGSSAEASHLAAEFVGRCVNDRQPLPALALNDSTTITAVGNDYGFDAVFARGVRALGAPGDILVAMSTSGGSPNIIEAMSAARDKGMTTIAMTGRRGEHFAAMADHGLIAPSEYTARAQEVHLLWGHGWCEAADAHWLANDSGPVEPQVTQG